MTLIDAPRRHNERRTPDPPMPMRRQWRLIVLLTTVYVKTPLEFNIFPSLLLATTLARLVLNVATTRLILTHADSQGMDAAGAPHHGGARPLPEVQGIDHQALDAAGGGAGGDAPRGHRLAARSRHLRID